MKKNEAFFHLKNNLETKFEYSDDLNFSQNLSLAIEHRNIKAKQLREFIKTEIDEKEDLMKKCSTIIDEYIGSAMKIAVTGRVNSGKSLFITELLDGELILPSSDEVTTRCITRIFYSEERIMNEAKFDRDKRIFNEKSSHKFGDSNSEFFQKYVELTANIVNSDERQSKLIEIGLPSNVLKSGIEIFDCPGFDETDINLTQIFLQVLNFLNISITCYTFDHNQGFNLVDGEILDLICAEGLQSVFMKSYFILIANKLDPCWDNDLDSVPEDHSINFDLNELNKSVRLNCKFQNCNNELAYSTQIPFDYAERYFKFDKDALLPVFPISTAEVHFGQLEDSKDENLFAFYSDLFEQIKRRIIEKIVEQINSITERVAYQLCEEHIEEKEKYVDLTVDLWFKFKYFSIENDLKLLIETHCVEEQHILMEFSENYKMFGLFYREQEILVTCISYDRMIDLNREKRRIYFERRSQSRSYNSLIYELSEESKIYIIEKDASHTRLLDCLNNFNFDQIESFINAIILKYCKIYNSSIVPNFRPDNIYLMSNGNLFISRTVPNDSTLPLILNRNKKVKSLHIHPSIKEVYPYFGSKLYSRHLVTDFIYSYGWFVFLLVLRGIDLPDIEYRSNLLEIFKLERFSSCPAYLKEVIQRCWDIQVSSNFSYIVNYLGEIYLTVASNNWIKEKSKMVEPSLKDFILSQCLLEENILVSFQPKFIIFGLVFNDRTIQVTQLKNIETADYLSEKRRLFRRKLDEKHQMIYEETNESAIYLIDFDVPHKRLIDCKDDLLLEQIEDIARQIYSENLYRNTKLCCNVRADTIFIDDNGNIHINRCVPNDPSLPLILYNKFAHEPLHIHPQLKTFYPLHDQWLENAYEFVYTVIEFFYSFGCILRILLEIGGFDENNSSEEDLQNCMSLLNSRRFPDYPDYLKEVMEICLSVNGENMDQYQDTQKGMILRDISLKLTEMLSDD